MMCSDAVGTGTITRLRALDTGEHPVLSIYLDLDSEPLATRAGRDAQLALLLDNPALAGARADIERVRGLLRDHPRLPRPARALAVFSCAPAGVLEAVPLPCSQPSLVVLDTEPWVEPLCDTVISGEWGVAVVGGKGDRLFRASSRSLCEFSAPGARARGPAVHGREGPGRSEARLGTPARASAERLLRAHRRRPFSNLAILAGGQEHDEIDAHLGEMLRGAVAISIAVDLTDASTSEILRVLTPMMEGVERTRERALIAALKASRANAGSSSAGLDATLAMFERGDVELLLIAEGASFTAGVCPRCGHVAASGGRCVFDEAELCLIDAVDYCAELAAGQRAQIVHVRHEAAALRECGSVAALPRSRTHQSLTAVDRPGSIKPSTKEASHARSPHPLGPVRRAVGAANSV